MSASTLSARKPVAAWLLLCAALVFAMVVVGGVTRLTHSGLSMVEWEPLVGAVPPLSQADWQALFERYQQTPEFKQVNHAMDVEGFKTIFWWEYFHRLLGRTIGLVFLLPFLWFLLTRKVSGRLAWQLGGIFLLGALQGALGWYMVKSGLVEDPRVSHFRLTAHLGVALAIFAAEFWIALGLLAPRKPPADRLAAGLAYLVFAMALAGAMVAGLRAGYAYNTFPLMNGHLVPPETFMLEPWWRNFLYNMAAVQLVHRAIFWVLLVLVPLVWWRHRALPSANVLLGAFIVQASLGIATLLLRVPVALAALHQAGAVLLFAAALWTAHASRRVEDSSSAASGRDRFAVRMPSHVADER
ncbi:MAG TPA: COX15/CtaA family protein [Burkholderiales bacterium]|nr:COX15/CtaA family protein [Burkholderiales bacterium]